MKKSTKIIIAIASSIILGVSIFFIAKSKAKGKSTGTKSNEVDKSKNYIIGDSQTPLIDKNSEKATTIGAEGESSLWKSRMGIKWLKDAVDAYKESPDVNSIVINIGTNDGFTDAKDNVLGLVNSIKLKFPNATLYAVKGSWGWGGNKNVTQQKVDAYYDKFSKLGVVVLSTAIGSVNDPHSNLPVYAQIGKEIDSKIE